MLETRPPKAPIRLDRRIRYRTVDGDGVLLHLDTGRVLVVNEVGLRIVELLGQPTVESELVETIAEEFEVTPDQARTDLHLFLSQLDAEQVLASGDESDTH